MDRSDATTGGVLSPRSEELEALRHKIADYDRWFATLDNQIRQLEGERQKLSALVQYTDAGFLVLESDDRVSWANAVFRERFRQPQGAVEPEGLACHQVLCRKPTSCASCPVRKLFESSQVCHHEVNLFLGDGFRPVYVTAMPVRSMDGRIAQCMAMLQDLSNLKVLRRSEEALRLSERRFRSIFEQAGTGMVTIRGDGSLLQANQAFCTMLGYTESELLRMNVVDVTHPADQDGVRTLFQEPPDAAPAPAPAPAQGSGMENRYLRRDGTTVWCQTTSVLQAARDRGSSYSVILVQDISERKRAERALEQSQRRYEALVHSIDGIVWEADPRAFRFSFVSKQCQRILGHAQERWLSQPRFWRNQIHPDDLERVLAAVSRVVADKRGLEVEYRMVAADGRTVWLRDNLSVVLESGDVAKLRGLMVDITERKQAEEALRHSEEQLRQSQKMEAIGRLAGGIAHDFNNLLTAITGYGDFLVKRLGDAHPLRREATEICKAAQRAADLTGQMLAFSRQQVLQPKVIDLNAVVADMEAMLRRMIPEDVELRTALGPSLGAVKADPGQLQQVILNLVVNARDAMPEGGEVLIATSETEVGPEAAVELAGLEPGPYVMLVVRDTGTGIDDEIKPRLFEPFFSTKEPGKGTGLGLSTVYGIVKQSGGHIVVDSDLGQGATFTVYLPRSSQQAVEQLHAQEVLPDMAPGTERILLVEDDEPVRELAREILEMNGYTVHSACNGMEALAFCEKWSEPIDMLATDLVMPQLGGRDLARRVSELRPGLKVLFLSGYTDSAVMHQGLLEPGAFFLQKPFTPAMLAHKVREVLDS